MINTLAAASDLLLQALGEGIEQYDEGVEE
jgi:hypothetical protein